MSAPCEIVEQSSKELSHVNFWGAGALCDILSGAVRAQRYKKPKESTLFSYFLGYNPSFTTKRAGIYRPFFLVDCF